MSRIVGVAYPIPRRYVSRFFGGGRTVFVKPASTYRHLKSGMRFLFYRSGEDPALVGEARIKRIFVSENPLQFLDTYGDRLFLDRDELLAYMQSRGSGDGQADGARLWVAIELENIQPRERTEGEALSVPAGGQYIRE
ncbi:MAG: DUF365 domain-containing protein [Methanomicrobiales archaeon]|nr:DUF365 domain-containing protein [Methanomicrobiales archaeon]MDI6876932.1 DUF365 domain-containing protein [Methanomicrobiales archaeon]